MRVGVLCDTRVVMERDCKAQDVAQWEPWYGEVSKGVFWTEESLASIREEWLREGVVPQAGASGFNEFSWIRRFVEGSATCEVRQVSKYFEQTKGCMARLGVPYSGCSPGRASREATTTGLPSQIGSTGYTTTGSRRWSSFTPKRM